MRTSSSALKRQRDAGKGGGAPGKSSKQQNEQTAAAAGATAARAGMPSDGGAGSQPRVVVLVDKSVLANDARRKIATKCAKERGTFLVLQARSPEECPHPGPAVTHLVLGSFAQRSHDPAAAEAARRASRQRLAPLLARWPGVQLLNESWLTRLTTSGSLPDSAGFEMRLDDEGPRAPPPEGKYERWLGRWSPELDELDDVALMLQATFNDQRCARIGNSAIVAGLRELKQYEVAVQERDDVTGTRALAYARAAASVQACAFRICDSLIEPQLVRLLPFVNASCATVIRQLAASSSTTTTTQERQRQRTANGSGGSGASPGSPGGGVEAAAWGRVAGQAGPVSEPVSELAEGDEGGGATCDRLELFRRDLAVRDGKGGLRPDSAGAASRRRLTKLPYVGPATAKLWYDKGCRTLDDALAAMRAGTLQPLSRDVAWALDHHEELTSDVTAAEVAEMEAATAAALAAATPLPAGGWVVQLVGGGRRGRASHDVDLMVSHPGVTDQDEMGGHFTAAVEWLVEKGHLLPPRGNCSRMTQRSISAEEHVQRTIRSLGRSQAEEAGEGEQEDARGKSRPGGISDGLHHVFGVFRTSSGRLKRLDLLFAAWTWLPHALLGWSGSAQFLRFLHQAAADRGFRRTNHALYRLDSRRPVSGIRDEAAIFEALGLPYREPQDRQC
ncbi:hypothetical protein PLESTB_000481100 [Pleodorina starrii]|uniref:DNA-directed DNA polymerase X domain-containing protein n=1 Tax=Pleodorina starrii TaxID=330485 RepID=A0A9W6EZN4_9CHLO|nr:hypothetical protein PLESTM_001585400 [Pleodorina starrii]GLC51238.1 hypothetical protein PLESTB_000481100 [Pleodorina starrii]GLC63597.1 hypothetical protein PLESTF_000053500 [Pleodorina starrii]